MIGLLFAFISVINALSVGDVLNNTNYILSVVSDNHNYIYYVVEENKEEVIEQTKEDN